MTEDISRAKCVCGHDLHEGERCRNSVSILPMRQCDCDFSRPAPTLDDLMKQQICPSCEGKGTEADYVGLEMRCVEVECSRCKGKGTVTKPKEAEGGGVGQPCGCEGMGCKRCEVRTVIPHRKKLFGYCEDCRDYFDKCIGSTVEPKEAAPEAAAPVDERCEHGIRKPHECKTCIWYSPGRKEWMFCAECKTSRMKIQINPGIWVCPVCVSKPAFQKSDQTLVSIDRGVIGLSQNGWKSRISIHAGDLWERMHAPAIEGALETAAPTYADGYAQGRKDEALDMRNHGDLKAEGAEKAPERPKRTESFGGDCYRPNEVERYMDALESRNAELEKQIDKLAELRGLDADAYVSLNETFRKHVYDTVKREEKLFVELGLNTSEGRHFNERAEKVEREVEELRQTVNKLCGGAAQGMLYHAKCVKERLSR